MIFIKFINLFFKRSFETSLASSHVDFLLVQHPADRLQTSPGGLAFQKQSSTVNTTGSGSQQQQTPTKQAILVSSDDKYPIEFIIHMGKLDVLNEKDPINFVCICVDVIVELFRICRKFKKIIFHYFFQPKKFLFLFLFLIAIRLFHSHSISFLYCA